MPSKYPEIPILLKQMQDLRNQKKEIEGKIDRVNKRLEEIITKIKNDGFASDEIRKALDS